jgi:hypothetical protein
VAFFIGIRFDVEWLQERHTDWKGGTRFTNIRLHNKQVITSLDLPENYVIFNAQGSYIETMFYTGLPAYSFIPTREQCEDLAGKGRRMAIFNPSDRELPEYMFHDSTLVVIYEELW